MSLVMIGISHHTSPVEVRERLAFSEQEVRQFLRKLLSDGHVSECVLLSTCNRVELYARSDASPQEATDRMMDFLIEDRQCDAPTTRPTLYSHAESDCVEHLFKVASGLDSLVLGETEILGQLKRAYQLSIEEQVTGRWLNKLFQKAFNVAKLLRSNTGIQRGSTSVGSVAVELAERIFDGLQGKRVMVIGAGDTSEKTARSLLSRGAASVIVTNRSMERAQTLAQNLGGRAVAFDAWQDEFRQLDIVISSTSAPTYVINRLKFEQLIRGRSPRPLLLIDIAVPRDIDPEINEFENVYVYNIDHLQSIAQDYLQQRQGELARCEATIQNVAREWLESLSASQTHPKHPDSMWHPGTPEAS